MYHSITFGTKNTWDDWHLVPEEDPLVAPPKLVEKMIAIPGATKMLDLTDAQVGYPQFENRTGTWNFKVLNSYFGDGYAYKEPTELMSEIMNYLHGKRMKCILEDDSSFYYYGRFQVASWNQEPNYSTITIDYDLLPFKREIYTTEEDWLWDPFSFKTGVIENKKMVGVKISKGSTVTITLYPDDWGSMPVIPKFKTTASTMKVAIKTSEDSGFSSYKTFHKKTGSNNYTVFEEFALKSKWSACLFKFYYDTYTSSDPNPATVSMVYRRGSF